MRLPQHLLEISEKEKKGQTIWLEDKTGYFIDQRDQHKYKAVKIHDQIWMAENLAYAPVDGNYWAYDDDQSNIAKYGYLYDWEAANNVCPSGWRLPSERDFEILIKNIGGPGKGAYKNLIKGGGSDYSTLFAGWRSRIGSFRHLGGNTYFWSSSTDSDKFAWDLHVDRSLKHAYLNSHHRSLGLSVRCLQDKQGKEFILKQNIERKDVAQPRKLKLFLVSSQELQPEREKIEREIGRKNKDFKKRGFEIDLIIWEDKQLVGKSFRTQDNINLEAGDCSLFVMMFYSKVGKFSWEEFENAKSRFDQEGLPRFLIFQKDIDLPRGLTEADAESLFAFRKLLRNENHFPEPYENEDELVNKLLDSIDKLMLEEAFVEQLPVN